MAEQLAASLSRLKAGPASAAQPPLDIFYLHAPDHNTPLEETLGAVHAAHAAGWFRRFGLSNYPAWRVAQIYHLCLARGWVLPTVYQGAGYWARGPARAPPPRP